MTGRKYRLAAVVGIAAAAAFTFGAVGGHTASAARGSTPFLADTDDNYIPASTHVTGTAIAGQLTSQECFGTAGHTIPTGAVTCFAVPGSNPQIVVFCTNSVAGGTTPATGIKPFAISPRPVFNDGSSTLPCKDNLNGTDKSTSFGAWKLSLLDAAGDESATEPNSGDRLKITVPLNGVEVVNANLGCTIWVNPDSAHGGNQTKPFSVIGAYDDVNTLTVSLNNLPVSTLGAACTLPLVTQTTFHAVYQFSPGVHDGS